MPDNTIDGTPDAVKVACPVWSGGKSGDYFKGLPITISRNPLVLCLVAYIVFEGPEEERNMNTLVEMINSMEVREDDEPSKTRWTICLTGWNAAAPSTSP